MKLDHLQWIVLYTKYDPSPSKKWERWQNCRPQNHTFVLEMVQRALTKAGRLHSTKREQWLPLAAWLALSGFGFQFLSLISAFFYFSGQSSFFFCEHLFFFIARKSVSGFPKLLCWLRSTKVQINILTIYKIFWKIDLSIRIFLCWLLWFFTFRWLSMQFLVFTNFFFYKVFHSS